MSNTTSITQQLDQHLNTQSDSPVAIVTEHGVAYLDVASVDQWSCRLDAVRYSPGPGSAISDWKRLADEIVQRVRYLAEPLAVIECDEQAMTSQIRSSPPRVEAKRTSYFECAASSARITIQRFSRVSGQARTITAFGITRESLAQLLVDLDGCLAPVPNAKPSLRDRIRASS